MKKIMAFIPKGIIPPIITPLTDEGEVNYPVLRQMVDHLIDNIIAIKDSTGDMTNTAEYIRLTRDNDSFHVLCGRDTLIYAALCYGATGSIASCANVAPRAAVDIYEKYMAGDHQGALDAQFQLAPLRIACNMGTFPAVIKEGLVQQGIPAGKCLAPIAELKPEEKEKLHQVLADMGLV